MSKHLLTKDEVQNQWTAMVDEGYKGTIKGYIDYKTMKLFLEAQDRKSRKMQLKQLEKEGVLRCDFTIQRGKNRCYRKTCRRCAALREVGL